jgi:hypothetical protein
MEKDVAVMPAPMPLREAMSSFQPGTAPSLIVVADPEGEIYGIVQREYLLKASIKTKGSVP